MKKNLFLLSFVLLTMTILFTSCGKETEPEDISKFSTKSIVGIWVAVDENNEILYYYDIKSDKHLEYVEYSGDAATYGDDGYMHISDKTVWKSKGDMVYIFDEKDQVIRITDGTLYGFDAKAIAELLGSDEIFDVQRLGLDEAFIYDKTGWLLDAHVYRIKGTIKDK